MILTLFFCSAKNSAKLFLQYQAKVNLAHVYETGECVPRDEEEANKWHAAAQAQLEEDNGEW